MKTIGKRQLREELQERIRAGIESIDVYQKCPYTCVSVTASFDGQIYTELGFSKVRWPDPWVESEGTNLAVKKAIAGIAKPIVNRLFEDCCSPIMKRPVLFNTFVLE